MADYHNVPVKRATWLRLRDYKMVSATYDDVLNQLMDSLPLETVTKEVLAEHKHRMATFEGRPWHEIRDEIDAKRKSEAQDVRFGLTTGHGVSSRTFRRTSRTGSAPSSMN